MNDRMEVNRFVFSFLLLKLKYTIDNLLNWINKRDNCMLQKR